MKVTTNTGHEIDEAEAARMAAAFEADDETVAEAVRQPVKRRGRPRLKGTTGKRSPKIEFRLGEEFHHKAALLAEHGTGAEGRHLMLEAEDHLRSAAEDAARRG